MNDNPLVSIITVSFNSEKTIRETIESIAGQTYSNFEYILMDGNSSDSTVSIAKEYIPLFKKRNIAYYIISETDNGIYDAMNKGIRLSSGDIIGIINSDDYYFPYTVEKVVDFYIRKKFDIMYADLRVFGNGKEFIKKSKYTKYFNTRFWNHPTTFVTKKVYEKQLYACQSIYDDLNFMLSARNNGFKIEILNETLANFRLGGISNKNSFKLMKKRIRLRNQIYKQNHCKRYRWNNFFIELAKYVLAR